ncbi:hypothetical protein EJB05_28948, partial [Eragrostis curvula]
MMNASELRKAGPECVYGSKSTKGESAVAILDPQSMTFQVIVNDREYTRSYVEKAMSLANFSKKEFLMFGCNTGGHWVAVVISLKWSTVWYMYSENEKQVDILAELFDESFANFIQSDPRRQQSMSKLKHKRNFPCHQQPMGSLSCGFYMAYHILYAASISATLKSPEDFSVPTEVLDHGVLSDIRRRIASFFVSESSVVMLGLRPGLKHVAKPYSDKVQNTRR